MASNDWVSKPVATTRPSVPTRSHSHSAIVPAAPYLKASPPVEYADVFKVADCSGVSFALERTRPLLDHSVSDGSHLFGSFYLDIWTELNQ